MMNGTRRKYAMAYIVMLIAALSGLVGAVVSAALSAYIPLWLAVLAVSLGVPPIAATIILAVEKAMNK